jgi:hypothetical protein
MEKMIKKMAKKAKDATEKAAKEANVCFINCGTITVRDLSTPHDPRDT